MAVRVAGLALGGRAEQGGHVVLALDVGLVREIEVAAIRLRLAGESGFQVVVGLGAFEGFHVRASGWIDGLVALRYGILLTQCKA